MFSSTYYIGSSIAEFYCTTLLCETVFQAAWQFFVTGFSPPPFSPSSPTHTHTHTSHVLTHACTKLLLSWRKARSLERYHSKYSWTWIIGNGKLERSGVDVTVRLGWSEKVGPMLFPVCPSFTCLVVPIIRVRLYQSCSLVVLATPFPVVVHSHRDTWSSKHISVLCCTCTYYIW